MENVEGERGGGRGEGGGRACEGGRGERWGDSEGGKEQKREGNQGKGYKVETETQALEGGNWGVGGGEKGGTEHTKPFLQI